MPALTLDDGRPTGALADWMERRLASQRPFSETQSWRDVRDELHAIASADDGLRDAAIDGIAFDDSQLDP